MDFNGYETGYDFFHDLLVNYGYMEALRIANNYLDMQSKVYGSCTRFYNDNPQEYLFCKELYNAIMKQKTEEKQ